MQRAGNAHFGALGRCAPIIETRTLRGLQGRDLDQEGGGVPVEPADLLEPVLRPLFPGVVLLHSDPQVPPTGPLRAVSPRTALKRPLFPREGGRRGERGGAERGGEVGVVRDQVCHCGPRLGVAGRS